MRFVSKVAIGIWTIVATMSGAQVSPAANAGSNGVESWSVITIASDGAWGASTNPHKASARLAAIRACRARSTTAADDCGERTSAVLGGWSLAYACGPRTFVVAEPTLEQARLYARYREIELRFAQSGGLELPRCRLVVTVGPDGTVSEGSSLK